MAEIKIRPKAVLGVIIGLFVLLGILNSVTVPLFEAPDELWHFSFVRYLALNKSLPVQLKEGTDIWLRESGQPPLYYLAAAPIVAAFDTSDFPNFVRFNVAHPAVTANSRSDAPNVFIHTPYETFPYRGSVLVIHLLRLFTLLWGVGAVVGVYLAARELMLDSQWLPLAAACLTAFNPHFIYISSVVNNDAAVACLATLTLWLCLRLLKSPQSRRYQIGLGIVLGLALLSKLSAVALLGIAGLALGMIWWRDRDTKAFFTRCLIVFDLALLIAGWWYARNWQLYGDPLGWSVWLAHAGVEELGILDLLRQIPQVAERFWSPYDALFSAWSLWLLAALTLVAVVGWIRLLAKRELAARLFIEGVVLSAVWFAVLCASLLRFMSLTPAANGRLLFPGIAAFSILWVLGFRAALPEKWTGWGFGIVIAGLLLLSLYSPLLGIAPRYASPLVKSSTALEGAALFDDAEFGAVRLLGVCVSPDTVEPGDDVRVTLYWEAVSTPPADLRVVIRLWTAGGRLIAQRDTAPASEIYPPDLWEPGDVIRDVHPLRGDASGPAMCRVSVSVADGDAQLGEVSSPLLLRLTGPGAEAPVDMLPLDYRLGGALKMQGYTVVYGGAHVTLALSWDVIATLPADYTVFAHVFDADGRLIGQGDGPPLNGDYPSSYWQVGDNLLDIREVAIQDTASEPAYLLVGFYRLSDGVRLPVVDAGGQRVPDDAMRLEVD
jgi:4-amino-4-deoxy-L-arabinose transferase-like glycosyltransferase